MNERTCYECKHKDMSVYSYPCEACYGGSLYEPEEGTAELKPCPFCGGEANVVKYAVSYGRVYSVACAYCNCRTGRYSSREKAADVWNRRDGERNA